MKKHRHEFGGQMLDFHETGLSHNFMVEGSYSVTLQGAVSQAAGGDEQ